MSKGLSKQVKDTMALALNSPTFYEAVAKVMADLPTAMNNTSFAKSMGWAIGRAVLDVTDTVMQTDLGALANDGLQELGQRVIAAQLAECLQEQGAMLVSEFSRCLAEAGVGQV